MAECQATFADLLSKLPAIISRDHVEHYLGGVISAKRLANLDSLGEGPPRFLVGRKVAYRTEDLLEWLASRSRILKEKEDVCPSNS
jgi:hypothetical protein